MSAWEARINVGSESDIKLPIFRSFAVGFLIEDIFLNKGSYIGTIADKETFGVSLLGCLLAFSLQDESYGGDKTIHRKNAIFNHFVYIYWEYEAIVSLILKNLAAEQGQHFCKCIHFPRQQFKQYRGEYQVRNHKEF